MFMGSSSCSFPPFAKSKPRPRKSQKAATRERRAEDGLDAVAEDRVRVADPGDRGMHVERHVELAAAGRAQDHACLTREERGANVVGVARHGRRLTALGEDAIEERA